MRVLGFVSIVMIAVCIYLANWAIKQWGFVPVGFGLEAPAGVFFAGVVWTFRDIIHQTVGRFWVAVGILTGAVMSYWVNPAFAFASMAAFAVSELCDWAVYEPLVRRRWWLAVVASGIVGLVVDSILFLQLAFGSTDYLAGQVVGKAWILGATVALLIPLRGIWVRRLDRPGASH